MNTYDLSGRVAVVTGAAQGIGLAIAKRLKDSGAAVASWDMNAERNASAMEGLGHPVEVDITDWNSIQDALAQWRNLGNPPFTGPRAANPSLHRHGGVWLYRRIDAND